jgi:hypothetical protein
MAKTSCFLSFIIHWNVIRFLMAMAVMALVYGVMFLG